MKCAIHVKISLEIKPTGKHFFNEKNAKNAMYRGQYHQSSEHLFTLDFWVISRELDFGIVDLDTLEKC